MKCKQCGVDFLKEGDRKNNIFCSKLCSNQSRSTKVTVSCAFCLISFKLPKARLVNKNGLYFCCRDHKDSSQRIGGLIQPDHYATGESYYRISALNNHGCICARCGYAEFKEILEVHHIDRNRSNNELSNLQVLCPNCHQVEHFLAKDGRYK
jgi:5-methylcytosine-specific restriction endonuclease McrA